MAAAASPALEGSAARALTPDQVLVDEPGEHVERRITDRLGRVERPAAGEDREPLEKPLLVGRQEREAPLDRREQRLLSRRCVAWTAADDCQLEPA